MDGGFIELSREVRDQLKVVCWDLENPQTIEQLRKGMEMGTADVCLFSDEWATRREQCRGFLRARAGIFERRLGARECEVREVPKGEAVAFLEAFHIQGANRLGVAYFGLYSGAELLGLLSLGRHSRQIAENRIVLDRLCFRSGIQVTGGASRLLRAAELWARRESYDQILTFSDNRLTDGVLYERLGFELERSMKPDYCYVRGGRRLSKQGQKKGSSKCPEGITEREWAFHRGLERIYDAGKKRWVINLWPEVHRTRNSLSSERCARMHEGGVFRHSHIRGYFPSDKNGVSVYFGSSYELRCLFLLEADPCVSSFRRCEAFEGKDGWRNPDVWVEFVGGRSEIWEVKPEEMLSHRAVREQVRESESFAASRGIGFRVWTEKDSGLGSDHSIVEWARKHLSSRGNSEYLERKKSVGKEKRRRYYERRIAPDKAEVWCDYCQTMHTPLKLTYTKNVARNGQYICERYGGYLAGKRPKLSLKKTNPYAGEGKKCCTGCFEIKPIELFDVRRASPDGRAFRCKACSQAKQNERRALARMVEPSQGVKTQDVRHEFG